MQNRTVVFVCDTSGSMNGEPKNAVLKTIQELEESGLAFEVINYSSYSLLLTGPSKFEALKKSWQSNMTMFCAAFETMLEFLSSHPTSEVDFVFLTDGQPSDRPLTGPTNIGHLKAACAKHGRPVTIHSFGLGRNSHLDLLETLRCTGTKEGVYSFASTSSADIVSELRILLSFAGQASEGTVTVTNESGALSRHSVVFYMDRESNVLSADCWLPSPPTSVVAQVQDCDPVTIELQLEESNHEFELARVRRDIYLVQKPHQVLQLEKRFETIRLAAPRYLRREIFAELIDLERELNEVRAVLSQQVEKKLTNNSEILGRFRALAFKGKMGKARREATMARRVLTNARFFNGLEEKLNKLQPPSEAELEQLDSNPEFRDDISHESLGEMLTENKQNFLVFGLSVERNEVVIDQPVIIKVTLGNTLVSWETLENAAEFQIARGNTTATGTFDISSVSKIMTGASNETINAGLPLYGCETHFHRIRVMLPILLGYFFTLSPTGFAPNQVPALYAVLARLHRQVNSERSAWIVDQFRRFLSRLMYDERSLDFLNVPDNMRPLSIVRRFTTDIKSHEKSELPTLDILYGCLLADDQSSIPPNFSGILMAEVIRRKFNWKMASKQVGEDLFTTQVRQLLFGRSAWAAPVAVQEAPYIDADGNFVPVTFQPYQPHPQVRLVDAQLLADLEIPSSVEEFLATSQASGLQLTQEQYDRFLFPCLLQGAFAPGNERFRRLIEEGSAILDPADEAAVDALCHKLATFYEQRRHEQWQAGVANQQSEEHAIFMCSLEDINQFETAVRALEVTHGKKIWRDLLAQLMPPEHFEILPLAVEKLAIILSGNSLSGERIIHDGPWMAGPVYGRFCRARLRKTRFAYILGELDGQSLQHAYRSSDLPNRHGHHLTNPLWVADPTNPSVPHLIRRWDK